MKKFKTITATFIMLALLCLLAVSCDSDKTVTGKGSLVAVSFDNMQSDKSLSSSQLDFDGSQLYWKYAARKADSTGFNAGETTTFDVDGAKWVAMDGNTPKMGLSANNKAYQVPGFSQGLWNFKLFGYKKVNSNYVLVYSGQTANAVALSAATNGNHLVSVTVSPASEGNGTLKISKDISLETMANTSISSNDELKRYYQYGSVSSSTAEPTSWSTLAELSTETDTTHEVAHGRYKVKVIYKIKKDNAEIEVSAGSTYATIYTNLETVVSGTLEEGSTYAEFSATDTTN